MERAEHIRFLRLVNNIAIYSKETGNMPFAAILVSPEGKVLLEQTNVEVSEGKATGHAETQLIEKASLQYDKKYLWRCTMYTTVEPCVMCAGAQYWANIGTVVYGMSEARLLSLTGSDEKNPTLDVPCRHVFEKGQKDIKVLGPFEEVEDEIAEVHKGFWTGG